MRGMFAGATVFSSDLSGWDVGRVRDMASMFENTLNFNSDLSQWEVSNVENMDAFVLDAQTFSQNLCAWGVRIHNSVSVENAFVQSGCPATNDPDLLAGPPGPFCFSCG